MRIMSDKNITKEEVIEMVKCVEDKQQKDNNTVLTILATFFVLNIIGFSALAFSIGNFGS
jgi:predicted transcriptional regulator